jgi:DNA-binding NtrC family response regulator
MKNDNNPTVFLVDDDAVFLKFLENDFLQHTDFTIETYSTGELCIKHLSSNPDVVILDYHLDGIDKNAMNGIQTLDQIKLSHPGISVVMLSAQEKIEEAIDCMSHKAIDYVVKSDSSFSRLQNIIDTITALPAT